MTHTSARQQTSFTLLQPPWPATVRYVYQLYSRAPPYPSRRSYAMSSLALAVVSRRPLATSRYVYQFVFPCNPLPWRPFQGVGPLPWRFQAWVVLVFLYPGDRVLVYSSGQAFPQVGQIYPGVPSRRVRWLYSYRRHNLGPCQV